ncbi:MAG: nucleotide sugar dehydrogenase, partial [Candidatus Daviesbacteria bacterium]|nr:nucleotide sugar dehydrogenase [Candidatus Daviesbacteria bacterium]
DDTYSPNFSDIEKLIRRIAPVIKPGHTIILRSTVSPGATEQLARQFEEQTKLVLGESLFLAYCPERIAEGKSIEELDQIPQIIGTLDEMSAKKASEVFEKIAPSILLTNPRSAELAKLFCNMHRYIDFAIGNEFMMIAESYGCDIYEVLNLVNKDYKRGNLKSPGFTAGPCLVKDGFFLIDKSPYMELVTAAWRLNENIPGYLLSRVKAEIKDLRRKKVAILGLAFKKNIDDTRYSLSPKLQRYFLAEGAKVSIHDPLIDSEPLEDTLRGAEILIMGINHDAFSKISLEYLGNLVSPDCLIVDIWNIFKTGKIVFYLKDFLDVRKQVKIKGNGELRLKSLPQA